MADQSIFKNLLEEALGPITQELKLLAKAHILRKDWEHLKRIKEQDSRIEGLKSKVAHL